MAFLFRSLIAFFGLFVLPILAIIALAPHFRPAEQAGTVLVVAVQRVWRTSGFLRNRHPDCSVAELWRMTTPGTDRAAYQYKVLAKDGSLHLVQTAAGDFWSPARDLPALLEMADEQMQDIYGTQPAMIRSGDVVVDVGANVGLFTRKALSKGAKLVVAVEPNPELVDCLRRNFAAEIAQQRVVIYPKGLWDKDAELMLTTNDANASTANSVAIPRGQSGPIVPLTTMDKMVQELRLEGIDFVKMDIEGAEPQALNGGRNTIQRLHPRMAVALEHRASDVIEIPALLRSIRSDAQISLSSSSCTVVGDRVVPQVAFVR